MGDVCSPAIIAANSSFKVVYRYRRETEEKVMEGGLQRVIEFVRKCNAHEIVLLSITNLSEESSDSPSVT